MATLSLKLRFFLYAYLFVLSQGRTLSQTHHTLHLSSLFPSDSCEPSTSQVEEKKTSLKVVHKHGPCSPLNQGKAPNHTEILLQDESRVKFIQSKLSGGRDVKVKDATATLPVEDGRIIGSGCYIVTVGLGTPKKDLSLIFDTGSVITWTQCEPCIHSCYGQIEPIFNPFHSTSYSNISFGSPLCDSLKSATGNEPRSASSTCVYEVKYENSSSSSGFFAKEKLTLSPNDVFDNFYFGCGQNNRGDHFGGSAGLLGLANHPLSMVYQTAGKYMKIFSYCLPSSISATGFLNFGGFSSSSAQFTPISRRHSIDAPFYGLDFTGISVGESMLPIPRSVFSTAPAIIDSGVAITWLPPAAYSALRSKFREKMSMYPRAPPLLILDTCYNLSSYGSINVPPIAFYFNGGVKVEIVKKGILFENGLSQVCLAFAGNSEAHETAIFGNTQQMTMEVVYDLVDMRIGFVPAACS